MLPWGSEGKRGGALGAAPRRSCGRRRRPCCAISPRDMPLGNVRLTAVVGAIVFASCASPPPTAPSAGQVAGAWVADSTLTAVSGGECVGTDLGSAIGRRDVFLAALDGQSAIDATITSQGNGTSCEYAGPNANGALTLSMTRCQSASVTNVPCSAGGLRDL